MISSRRRCGDATAPHQPATERVERACDQHGTQQGHPVQPQYPLSLGEQHFRVITGAFDGGRDKYWFTRHMPTDGSVTFTDMSSSLCTIGVWGPNAAKTLAKITTDHTTAPYDLSQDGFPYGAVQDVLIDGVPCTGHNSGQCIGLAEESEAMGPQPVPRSTVSSSP